MMKKEKRIALFLLLGLFAGGCSRGQEGIVVIGQDGNAAGSLEEAVVLPSEAGQAETPPKGDIYVYVCGAVKEPGVVALEPGSRVGDALRAAGGFARDADENHVNLAAWVADGEQVYFPTKEEVLTERAQEAESGLVNINTADAAALSTLPGIGESRAEDIIRYRKEKGIFETKEDIMKVSGIKDSVFDKIRDKITVE